MPAQRNIYGYTGDFDPDTAFREFKTAIRARPKPNKGEIYARIEVNLMEKRRRKRIQGSWATQARIKPTPKPEEKQEENTKTQPQSQQKFVFQADVVNKTKRAPPERIITEEGSHEISSGPTGVSVIEFVPDFLSKEEREWMFEQLEKEIPWEEKKIKIKGEFHTQPRLTAWFGDFPYTYSGLTLQPYQWSPVLNILRDKIFNYSGLTFNSMLANLYRDDKDSVDWHSDDEPSLGSNPVIASLSFGDMRNFELRKKPPQGEDFSLVQHIKIPLSSGSLLIMKGATQQDWQHRVPKEYHHRDPRINLTFRNILPSELQKTS